ncbi:MAG: AI-2E family transporter [Candidatus Roizmanbacteria bacterium]|nr:MAG: AI-2E family transporter [Candidatus Roizmanbacteria bacterium]
MRKIEISRRTIVFAVFFILSLYLLWIIKELLFSLLIAFILMSALRPAVKVLEKRGLPRKPAAIVVYLLFIFFFIYLFSIIVPPIITEGGALIKSLPGIVKSLVSPEVSSWLQLESLTQYIPNITRQAFEIVGGIFSNIFFVVTTLFFGLYFIIEEDIIKKFITKLFDGEKAIPIVAIFEKAEKRMSAWFWGELTLMFVVGIFTFIGLNLIGMKYALPLAVLAGLLEVVPNIGPVISAIPAILIGLSTSYVLGIAAVALYFIVQQLENNLIVPWIMRRAVGLDPIITLVALIIGGKLGGVLGVLLSIPILLFLETVVMEIKANKSTFDNLF